MMARGVFPRVKSAHFFVTLPKTSEVFLMPQMNLSPFITLTKTVSWTQFVFHASTKCNFVTYNLHAYSLNAYRIFFFFFLIIIFIYLVLQLEFHKQSIFTLVCVACKHHGSFSVANMPEEGNNFDELNIIDV